MKDEKIFLGARIEPEIIDIVDKVAKDKGTDRTGAIKVLISIGYKELNLEKVIDLYRKGKISIDKAAKISCLSVSEMMDEIAKEGIKSDESIEEYIEGVKNLM